MQSWEILILKPTRVFLSFIAAQLPTLELPTLKQLNEDNTAYVIKKFDNDEDTFNEIERHFALMFRHEIKRWFGIGTYNKIEGTFLDFLCCFKFELHSHILLMESTLAHASQLLRIKPRSILLRWLKSAIKEEEGYSEVIQHVNLARLVENATVVVKNFADTSELKLFLCQNYPLIFAAEMARMSEKSEGWPTIDSLQTFNRYFSTKLHTHLVHLS